MILPLCTNPTEFHKDNIGAKKKMITLSQTSSPKINFTKTILAEQENPTLKPVQKTVKSENTTGLRVWSGC